MRTAARPEDAAMLLRQRAGALPAGRPLLVAVDGRGGSGKSTLARLLQQTLPNVTIVHGDDFYREMPEHERAALDAQGGYERYFDWQRLESQVLAPLRAGRAGRYRRYDWQAGALGEWVDVPPPGRTMPGVVIVEGVYAARPELRAYYDLAVLVDTPPALRAKRLAARTWDDPEWVRRWDAAESHYLTHAAPEVDLTVAGTEIW